MSAALHELIALAESHVDAARQALTAAREFAPDEPNGYAIAARFKQLDGELKRTADSTYVLGVDLGSLAHAIVGEQP